MALLGLSVLSPRGFQLPASASLTGSAGIASPGMITDKYYCCVRGRCLSAEVIASLKGRVSADRPPHLAQQQGGGKWWYIPAGRDYRIE